MNGFIALTKLWNKIIARLFHILAQFVDGGADSDTWDLFSDMWKLVLRNLFDMIADNGGWVILQD